MPEYANFDGESCFGDQELVAMVSDILPEHRGYISFAHWLRLWQSIAQYGAVKIRNFFLRCENDVGEPDNDYDVWGDAKWRYSLRDAQLVFPSVRHLSERNFSPTVLRYIRNYIDACNEKGIQVILFPPCYQAQAYDNQADYIHKIVQELERSGMPFIVPSSRYRLAQRYFYDSPYHLNLLGREERTRMMAEDLLRFLKVEKKEKR